MRAVVYRNKTYMCLYRNKNQGNYIIYIVTLENLYIYTETITKNSINIQKQKQKQYIYTIISPEKYTCAQSSQKKRRRKKKKEPFSRHGLEGFFHLRRRIV